MKFSALVPGLYLPLNFYDTHRQRNKHDDEAPQTGVFKYD